MLPKIKAEFAPDQKQPGNNLPNGHYPPGTTDLILAIFRSWSAEIDQVIYSTPTGSLSGF
jgi:hypothetical protein